MLVRGAPIERLVETLADASDTPPARLHRLLRERFDGGPSSLAERFQVGDFDARGFHGALNRRLVTPIAYPRLVAAVEAMLLGECPGMVRLLGRLAQRHRLACYSNTNVLHWRHMQRHYTFFERIERPFASQDIGYAKPDRRGFDRVASALGTQPARLLLIDDRPVNVDGARAAGWQALRFTDRASLMRDLVALGAAERA